MAGVKANSNMDSVFSKSVEDELEFDAIFTDDDSILEFVAGYDEMGVPLIGADFDYSKIVKEADMIEDIDDAKARDGEASNCSKEGTVCAALSVGGEVGSSKSIVTSNSAESKAHETDNIEDAEKRAYGSDASRALANAKAMEIAAVKFADHSCKENAEYYGYEELVEAVVSGYMSKDEIFSENASKIAIATADYLIKENCPDCEARAGKTCPVNAGNKEGVKSKVIGAAMNGRTDKDPIADTDDADERAGKVAHSMSNVEGKIAKSVSLALESDSNDGDLDTNMSTLDPNSKDESMDKEIVPDSVKDNSAANMIDKDVVNTQESTSAEYVAKNYKMFLNGLRTGLRNMALSEAVSDNAASVCIESYCTEKAFKDCDDFNALTEAVLNDVLSENEIKSDNAMKILESTIDYILEKTVTVYADQLKTVDKDGNVHGPSMKDRVDGIAQRIQDHPKAAAAIGAGAIAGAAGATVLARKIAAKKKAEAEQQKKNQNGEDSVKKENFEYSEYNSLIEAVVAGFDDNDIMREDAADLATSIADILIENAVKKLAAEDDDDDMIAAVNAEKDPDVKLSYGYDDDELIDIAAAN